MKSKVRVFLDLKAAQLALKRSNEALRESEGHKKAILESAINCIINIDQEGRILDFNLAAERTLGVPLSQVQGKVMADSIIAASFRDKYLRALSKSHRKGPEILSGTRLEGEVIHADGQRFPVELAISRISIDGPPRFTVFVHDISERKRTEQVIADQAIRDPLTDLYNRRYFNDQARQAISRARRNNKPMALLFCDMDRFKSINDQRGHHTGNQVKGGGGKYPGLCPWYGPRLSMGRG